VEPTDLTVRILQDIRQEIAEARKDSASQGTALRSEIVGLREEIRSFETMSAARFEVIESTLRDLAQQLVVLGRAVKVAIEERRGTADRFDTLEQRVADLEKKVG
jgi:phage shock protein A